MYIARKNGKVGRQTARVIVRSNQETFCVEAPDHKVKRVWVTCKGTVSGLFFDPPKLNMHTGKENDGPEMSKQKSLEIKLCDELRFLQCRSSFFH